LHGFANRPVHILQSTFYAHAAILKHPDLASNRAKRDADLCPEIKRVWEENNEVYGTRTVWHQMQHETFTIARGTADRLMKRQSIHGVIRGNVKKTPVPDKSPPCPKDKVSRKFRAPAPNMLWGNDFTYVATWQGVVYVTFIVDTFADKIVGSRISSSPKTDFVLDCFEHARHDRRPVNKGGLSHHSDRGGNICPLAKPSGWPSRGSCPRLAASVTFTITPLSAVKAEERCDAQFNALDTIA
jgi:putative transposase